MKDDSVMAPSLLQPDRVYLHLYREAWFYCWVNDMNHQVDDTHCVAWSSNKKEEVSFMLSNMWSNKLDDIILNGNGDSKPTGIFGKSIAEMMGDE